MSEEQDITFSLTSLIDQAIKDNQTDKEYNSWRASSLGGCPRSHFFKRLGVEPTTPPNDISLRKFEVGNVFHKWIQDVAENNEYPKGSGPVAALKTPLSVEVEGEIFDKDLDLGGRYDLLIGTNGKRILYDIKTVHSRAFWQLERSGGSVKDQWPQYWIQLGAYMLMLKRAGTPVDQGRILLVSKDDLVTKEVIYHLTPELEKAVMDEVNLLNKHWAQKTLPPCTCEGWRIQYCSYGEPVESGKPTNCCGEHLYEQA